VSDWDWVQALLEAAFVVEPALQEFPGWAAFEIKYQVLTIISSGRRVPGTAASCMGLDRLVGVGRKRLSCQVAIPDRNLVEFYQVELLVKGLGHNPEEIVVEV
jgi:hypothetical protein